LSPYEKTYRDLIKSEYEGGGYSWQIKKLKKQTICCIIEKDYFFLKKYTPVKTQVAARIKKITVNTKFLDKPAAIEKNSALTKQLTPAILPEIIDRRSMLNRRLIFY
jgi:hypothetical protein